MRWVKFKLSMYVVNLKNTAVFVKYSNSNSIRYLAVTALERQTLGQTLEIKQDPASLGQYIMGRGYNGRSQNSFFDLYGNRKPIKIIFKYTIRRTCISTNVICLKNCFTKEENL